MVFAYVIIEKDIHLQFLLSRDFEEVTLRASQRYRLVVNPNLMIYGPCFLSYLFVHSN